MQNDKLSGWLTAGSSERIEKGCLTQFEGLGNVSKRKLHLKLYKIMAKHRWRMRPRFCSWFHQLALRP